MKHMGVLSRTATICQWTLCKTKHIRANLNGQKNGANAVRCRPVLLQNVQTDVAGVVHVGVEARRIEAHQWRLKGVVL